MFRLEVNENVSGYGNHNLAYIKGCGMGPWLVLFSPCFRENVVATCKIGSFLGSFDNLLQKNVIALFFWKSNFKIALIWKKGYFWPTFHIFLVTRESYKNSFSTYLTHIHVFCSPYWLFLPYQLWKKYEFIRYGFSLVWVLVLILIRAILEQSINNKMVSKTQVGMSTDMQWRNRRGGGGQGQGAECPPETSDREIFADVSGKKRQGKKGKGVKIEKKRRKIVKGKAENLKWKWK